MATIKVACPKCGQKVSGDESFYGTAVECPICSSEIYFPGQKRTEVKMPVPVPPESSEDLLPPSFPPRGSYLAIPDTTPDGVIAPANEEKTSSTDKTKPDPAGTPEMAEGNDGLLLPPSPIFGAISIVSAVLGVVTCLGGLLAPITIICGHAALAKARHSPVQPAPGHTLGAIGLIIGYVSLALTILFLLALTFFGESIREAWVTIQQMWD